MEIGGNARARKFFNERIPENLSIEEKYNSKAASLYRQLLTQEIENDGKVTIPENKETETRDSFNFQELKENLPQKSKVDSSLKSAHTSKPKADNLHRFLEDFDEDEDEWGEEESDHQYSEGEEEVVENEFPENDTVKEQKSSKQRAKGTRFMYSDGIYDDEESSEGDVQMTKSRSNVSNDKMRLRNHSLIEEEPNEDSNYDDLQRFFHEDERWRLKKVNSSVGVGGEHAHEWSHQRSQDDEPEDEYYDHYISNELETSDILTKIAETAKADLKSIGDSIVEGGKKLAEWFSEFTSNN